MEERTRMTVSTKEQLHKILGAMLSDLGRVDKHAFQRNGFLCVTVSYRRVERPVRQRDAW